MKKFRFSKEEKQIILEAYELIIIDIEKLWDKAKTATDEIFTYIFQYEDFYGFDDLKLVINDDGIKLVDDRVIGQPKEEIWLKRNNEPPKKRKLFAKKEESKEIDYNLYYNLIRNYKNYTRPKLINIIESQLKSKHNGLNLANDVDKEYSKTASIELMFQTQNQIPIEITRENNKTVGLLCFGGNVIKLVTNGDIVMKEPEKPIQKRK